MTHYPFIKSLLLLPVLGLSTQAMAQLKPMDDSALDSTVGQAYIEMDSYLNTNNSDQVSRITFGQTIKLQANADSLTLGDIAGNADIAADNQGTIVRKQIQANRRRAIFRRKAIRHHTGNGRNAGSLRNP